MTRQRKIYVAKCATILSAIPILILANQNGPDPRKTGGPGDSICAEATCHVGLPVNGGPGSVDISFSNGLTYTPGQPQVWTVTVQDPGASVFGFQASARPASNVQSAQAGRFRALDSTTFILCEDGRIRTTSGNCNPAAPLEFIEHNLPRNNGTFQLEWTPPANDVGAIRVFIAGNAANGNGQNTGDNIYTNSFTLQPRQLNFESPAIRAQQPVLQAFSGTSGLSSGTWLEIYGTNFAPITREWGGADFNGNNAPTSLDGVRVSVNGRPAFVRFISPNQVNVQAPDDAATGPVSVEVINPAGTSNAATVTKTRASPALLTTPLFNVGGRQYAAALHTDLATFVGRQGLIAGVNFRPVRPGETIIMYAVGCGATNPATPAGVIVTAVSPLSFPVQVTVGSTQAQANAFLSPPFIGLCRFDITVPNVPDGDVALDVTVDGTPTGQSLFTTVQR